MQARVAGQAVFLLALRVAVDLIEAQQQCMFAFVCLGATHRSVAACYLSKRVVYPEASIVLTPRRTLCARRLQLGAIARVRAPLAGQFVRVWLYGEVHVGAVQQVSEYAETIRIYWAESQTQSVLTMDSLVGIVS